MGEAKRRRAATGTSDTADPGFEGYRATLRSIFAGVTDREAGEAWMRGQEWTASRSNILVLHQTGEKADPDGDKITIGIVYGKRAFAVAVPVTQIDHLVEEWAGIVAGKGQGDLRDMTRQCVLWGLMGHVYVDNPGVDAHSGATMGAAMAWLAYTGPIGDALRSGGFGRIEFHVTNKGAPDEQNWRTTTA